MNTLMIALFLSVPSLCLASNATMSQRHFACSELLRGNIIVGVVEYTNCLTSAVITTQMSNSERKIEIEVERTSSTVLCSLSYTGSTLWPRVVNELSCEWIGPC